MSAQTQPTAYGFYHMHMPYRVKKFDTEQQAKRWAAKYGYKVDGTLSDSLYQAAEQQGDTKEVRNTAITERRTNGGTLLAAIRGYRRLDQIKRLPTGLIDAHRNGSDEP